MSLREPPPKALMVGLAVVALILLSVGYLCIPVQSAERGWKPLFNGKNLDGWYTFIPSQGKNHDVKGLFKVQNGVIHVYDLPVTAEKEDFGYIATEKEYENFHLRLEYKWGQKKFPPMTEGRRDTGVLYHLQGADKVWPRCFECQIQEGDTGDFYLVEGVSLDTRVCSREKIQYQPDGVEHSQTNGRIIKAADLDHLTDWNTVEVIARRDTVEHIINGRLNNRGWKLRQPDPNDPTRTVPVTRGRILLQAEGAEVFYRNISIQALEP